jgi:protein-S-isoprenylcysteine O-methyltransferase Ste14
MQGKPWKFWIDSHKGMNAVAVLALIAWYHAWDNLIAWIYLALHGTYGFLWILKSRYFGDKSWEQPVSLGFGLLTWFLLSLYWISPWLIVSGHAHAAPSWFYGVCVSMYAFGVFLHFASDMQKYMSLKYRRGTLITDGLWGLVRNPNYLGELLIYLGFSLLPLHWAPLCALGFIIATVWLPNMRKKDKSLSRYPEFAEYKAKSKLIIPYLI